MSFSPDQLIVWQWGVLKLNATILTTWGVMALVVLSSWCLTRRLTISPQLSRWQNLLEVLVSAMRRQIAEISHQDSGPYLAFVGTLFVFIATSNLLAVLPGYRPPTSSLSTTAALAICVYVAVPVFAIVRIGLVEHLRNYLRPTPFMLPFNIIGELSRTLALAVRLYGNMMSGAVIVGMLLSIAPFFFPVVMQLLGLLTGLIQAYIFALLAMIYIAAATQAQRPVHHIASHQQNGDYLHG